jgi:hypothetical protein
MQNQRVDNMQEEAPQQASEPAQQDVDSMQGMTMSFAT